MRSATPTPAGADEPVRRYRLLTRDATICRTYTFAHVQDDKAKDALVDQLIEKAMVENDLYGDPPEGDRSFEHGDEIIPVSEIAANEDKYKDFHDWARDTANDIRGSQMDAELQRNAGYKDYRTWMGIQT